MILSNKYRCLTLRQKIFVELMTEKYYFIIQVAINMMQYNLLIFLSICYNILFLYIIYKKKKN